MPMKMMTGSQEEKNWLCSTPWKPRRKWPMASRVVRPKYLPVPENQAKPRVQDSMKL